MVDKDHHQPCTINVFVSWTGLSNRNNPIWKSPQSGTYVSQSDKRGPPRWLLKSVCSSATADLWPRSPPGSPLGDLSIMNCGTDNPLAPCLQMSARLCSGSNLRKKLNPDLRPLKLKPRLQRLFWLQASTTRLFNY